VSIAGALNGLLQELLAKDALGAGNGVLQTVREGLRLGGPLTGAALFTAFGGPTVAIIDAATFVVAAIAIARMTIHEQPPERSAAPNWLREITVGLSYIRTEAGLRRMMAACAVAFLVIGINESLYYALVDKGLHRPPEFIGVLASAQGVGAVLGGLLSARLIRRLGELAATAIGLAACGTGAAVCLIPLLPTVLAGRAISGFGLAVTLVAFNTILQRRTPKALIGRVSMVAETFTSGPQAISIAAGATLVSILDYHWLLLIVLTGMIIGAVYLWTGRQLTAKLEMPQLAEIPSSRS
jgi:hypothetical protein